MQSLNYKFYKKAFDKHGVSAKGVHWNSKKTQYIRFNVLFSFINQDIEDSSILDIGCGFAELIEFFKNKEIYPKEYLGIDCEKFMIESSKKRFQNEKFLQCDILKDEIPKKDYLFCSGAFNILKRKDFFESIEKCYKASKKGFVFNFLIKDSFNKIKKEEVINFCETICDKVFISSPYLPNDITVFLRK